MRLIQSIVGSLLITSAPPAIECRPAPQAKAGDTELFQGQVGLFEKHAGIVLTAIMGQIDRTQTKGALRCGRAGVIG